MQLIKDSPFEVAWLVWMAKPKRPCLTVVIKGTFDVVAKGECPVADEQVLPSGDIHHDDDIERSLRYESDFAYLKPKGEVLLMGSCHAVGGSPTPASLAAFKVGSIRKKMAVIGERHFKGLLGKQTDPEPFTAMPLCWERSFGGKKSKKNPVGLGLDKSIVEKKAVIRLPNIENPDALIKSRRHRPEPIGAFPIPRTWPQRMSLTGTYDSRWQKTRWPWLPDDFQWSYFNAAPADQQLNGFFRGNEEIALLNLHPEHAKVNCTLPSLRARAFLRWESSGALKPLTPELDTITIDADEGRIFCLWRAVTEIPRSSLEDFSHLFVIDEKLSDRRNPGDYKAWFEDCLGAACEEEEAFEAEPIPKTPLPRRASSIGPPRVLPTLLTTIARSRPSRPALEAEGEPSAFHEPTTLYSPIFPDPVPLDSPVVVPMLSPEELEALYAVDFDPEDIHVEATELMDPRDLSRLIREESESIEEPLPFQDHLDAEATQAFTLDMFKEAIEPAQDSDATELVDPGAFEAFMKEEEAKRLAGEDEWRSRPTMSFIEHFSTLHTDLSESQPEPPFLRPSFDEPDAELEREPTPEWAGAITKDELRRATEARPFDEKSVTQPPRFTEEQQARRERVRTARETHESCAGWDLGDADLSELDLSGLDFTRAILTRAKLSSANLDDATFDGASLAEADLTGASLHKTSFKEADLTRVRGRGLELHETDLEDAVLVEAELTEATLRNVCLARAELGGVDLTGATATKVVFDGADLSESTLDQATFKESSFVDTDLGVRTSARKATFDGCDLSRLRASEGVDFTEASFVRATFENARLQNSTLRKANLSFASLDSSDFSDAILTKATLLGCRLRMACFDRAILADAAFGKSDLHKARFEGANLLRADLRGCNLFGAELLDASIVDTQLELANVKGTKLA